MPVEVISLRVNFTRSSFLEDDPGICTDCSPAQYINIKCMNGASATGQYPCHRHPIMFRADGSPPVCEPSLTPLLGHGRFPQAQKENNKLVISNYNAVLYDPESGIGLMNYYLVDHTTGVTVALPQLTTAGMPRVGRVTARFLNLWHGHR